jgi:hypothetical protein
VFPDLAVDLRLPPLFPPESLFSTVLRIGSGEGSGYGYS